jgi:hypothetical protein
MERRLTLGINDNYPPLKMLCRIAKTYPDLPA